MSTPPPDAQEWVPDRETYDKHASQAWSDQQASSDDFDKNLLTFSSGALGLSLAFIKDIVPLGKATGLEWLLLSWCSFAGCIVGTIASFQFGIQAQKSHLGYLEKYYLEGRREFFNKKSCWSIAVTVCAWVGSALFLLGLIGTITFAWKNISRGIPQMINDKKEAVVIPCDTHRVDGNSVALDARAPIAMTPASNNEERGRNPIAMTPARVSPVASPANIPPTQSPSTNSEKK